MSLQAQCKAPHKSDDGKMSPRWKEGIFLGYSRDSNEFVLWSISEAGVARARSIQRRPESVRWDADTLMKINQRPSDVFYRANAPLLDRRDPEAGFEPRVNPEDEPPKTRATATRDMKVTASDIERFGFTEYGCGRRD